MEGGWGGDTLSAGQVEDVLGTASDMGALEVTLTGGEITMHPEFDGVMDATHAAGDTGVSFVTNATRIDQKTADKIAGSGADRVCVSVDGPDAESHNSRRGRNFERVMNGLRMLRGTGKLITVISVVHQGNYERMPELSAMLAEQDLADQHHMCAPSYSGLAKKNYPKFALREPEFEATQRLVDGNFASMVAAGLYTTFNSYWPATGRRGESTAARGLTLIQLTEQVKDIYGIVRPNGDVRLTAAAWGRETVGNAVVGNLGQESAAALLKRVDDEYRAGVRQLPRDVEAGHKFQVGPYATDRQATNEIITGADATVKNDPDLHWMPARPVGEMDLLDNTFSKDDMAGLAKDIAANPQNYRIVRHASGADIVYNRTTSHVTLLRDHETAALNQAVDQYSQPPAA
jgi:MoaA/NifB/PqqE/SkfB family radical SAM enzyme